MISTDGPKHPRRTLVIIQRLTCRPLEDRVPLRAISTQCTLRLRHETGRRPDSKHKSLVQISFVDSTRVVQRPEHGKAKEVVVCDHCGRTVDFTVFSVKRTHRARTLWFALLMALLTLPVAAGILFFDMFASPDLGLIDAIPAWLFTTVATAGMLSLWVIGYSYFYWSDEFGIRSPYRWRHTGQSAIPDNHRGNFIAKCIGTWDQQDPPPTPSPPS
ncbi:hypothetical protein ACQPZP_02690 [Spirillospora sp. CA-142024]|uniref:hypothetical protein n=1 Tax=Spirillospora sp. CA-142024 TaxID=3240036 RepID=UPI003D91EFD8